MPHPKLPLNWTLHYEGIGVYPSSKAYTVCYNGIPQYSISVDKPQKGSHIPIDQHIRNIWRRELC